MSSKKIANSSNPSPAAGRAAPALGSVLVRMGSFKRMEELSGRRRDSLRNLGKNVGGVGGAGGVGGGVEMANSSALAF